MSMSIGAISGGNAVQQKMSQETERLMQQQAQQIRAVSQLESQQTAIQDQILQLQSSTDTAANAEDTIRALEQQLDTITRQLEEAQENLENIAEQIMASTQESSQASQVAASSLETAKLRQQDLFEAMLPPAPSIGLYEVQPDEEQGYHILYTPPRRSPDPLPQQPCLMNRRPPA